MNILQHRSASVNRPLPSIEEFLRFNPLPPALAHLEAIIRGLPDLEFLIGTVAICEHAGFNDDQIADALRQVAAAVEQPAQRCACCLAWRQNSEALAHIRCGVFSVLAICPVCVRLIESNRMTPAMERNFRDYAIGGE